MEHHMTSSNRLDKAQILWREGCGQALSTDWARHIYSDVEAQGSITRNDTDWCAEWASQQPTTLQSRQEALP
jgi:hypothetical protein